MLKVCAIYPCPDNCIKIINLPDGLQILGGYFEILRLHNGTCVYLNEDGKRLNLPPNLLATIYCTSMLPRDDYIVGHAIVVGPPDDDGNDTDCPQHIIDALNAMAMSLEIMEASCPGRRSVG